MTAKVRLSLAAFMLAATLGFVSATSASFALGDKDLRPDVIKIAGAFKAGKADDAKKGAVNTAKDFKDQAKANKEDELPGLMHLFRTRSKGGLGWGTKELGNPAEDGLEKGITKALKGVAAKDYPAVEEAGYSLAAMAQLIYEMKPAKDLPGGKTKKLWIEYSEQMRDASIDLSKASAAKNAAAIGKAVTKVNASCNNCHSKFKMSD